MLSNLIVVQSDPRLAEALRFGFEREGIRVITLSDADKVASALAHAVPQAVDATGTGTDLIVAGAATADAAQRLLDQLCQAQQQAGVAPPILYLGNGISRGQAVAAGASEFVPQPAFVRDVVTLGQLVAGAAQSPKPDAMEGQLSDYHGVIYLIRAMAAARRSAVLTLVRGLRRGELRFYQGEVTSAQVGMLHGMAALHQLLLWTRAHFELRNESVVRRQQIPLSHEEILADAQRFLREIRSVVGQLIPAAVYEQDLSAIESHGSTIPKAVYKVLGLIDGHRTMADVIEDAPYRVLETLRVANRLSELGLIRRQTKPKPNNISVEGWLANQCAEVSAVPIGTVELEPVGNKPARSKTVRDVATPNQTGPKTKPGKQSGNQSSPGQSSKDQQTSSLADWSDVLPIAMSTGFSPVVPAAEAAGEIVAPRSRTLDASTNGQRQRARGQAAGTVNEPEARVVLAEEEARSAVHINEAITEPTRRDPSLFGAYDSYDTPTGNRPFGPPNGETAPQDPKPSLWRRILSRGRSPKSAHVQEQPNAPGPQSAGQQSSPPHRNPDRNRPRPPASPPRKSPPPVPKQSVSKSSKPRS